MKRIRHGAVWMLAANCLLGWTATRAAASTSGACASIKAKATGIQITRSMVCHASATRKGAFGSFTCLANAQTKTTHAFAKADKKGPCGMADDATIVGDSVGALAEGMAAGLFPVDADDTARRCASAKMRRAGAYGRARLACWVQAFNEDAAIDPACQQAAAARLEEAFVKSEAKGDCATTNDRPGVQQAIDGFADAVAGLLMPMSTTTSTAMYASTTTTTSTAPSGSTTTSTAPSGSTTTTSTVPSVVSLSIHVQPIFTARCATAGCHAGAHPAQGLDLRAGYAYGNLVNVASGECPLFKRVSPNKPAQSYLVFKLAGPPQPCFSGNQMPGGGAPPLSTADQSLIATWIAQGAANN